MRQTLAALTLAVLAAASLRADPMGIAFTYQGKLNDGGTPANGTYDFRLTLYPGGNAGLPVTVTPPAVNPLQLSGVGVSNGLFTVRLDFGVNVFQGDARWLGIEVKTNDNLSPFAELLPRQELTASPYAQYAPIAGVANVANNVSTSAIIQGQALQVGVGNSLVGSLATISGGGSNSAGGSYAAVLGGFGNSAISNSAAIGGGSRNIASGDHALVAGGEENRAIGDHAFVGGGAYNSASGYDGVGSGLSNIVGADYSFVGGGQNNRVSELAILGTGGHHSFIGGGLTNYISRPYAAIGGGRGGRVEAAYGVLGGGDVNQVGGVGGVIGGGKANRSLASAIYSVVAGGEDNSLSGDHGVISGGWGNNNQTSLGTIGGGALNLVQAPYSATIAGGYQNTVLGQDAAIGGGSYNTVHANDATIAGGTENQLGVNGLPLTGLNSVIGGGSYNQVRQGNATVAGGQDNVIDSNAEGAAIPGGLSAHAFNYGQHVFASGHSNTRGDAQSSLYVLRRNTSGANTFEMFLDGNNGAKRIYVPPGSVWAIRIQVSAVNIYSLPPTSRIMFAAYEASGVVANLPGIPGGGNPPPPPLPIRLHLVDGSGNVITTARPIYESTIIDSAVPWQATPYVDPSDNTLRIAVNGSIGVEVKWTATIQTTEVLIP